MNEPVSQLPVPEQNAHRFETLQLRVAEHARIEALLAAETRVLASLSQGATLAEILDVLVRAIEELGDGVLGSVLLLDDEGRLHQGAAPSLPDSYNQAVEGVAIGSSVGSCGTAAYRRELVIVSDISIDPLWASYREIALVHGLRACWSSPILAGDRVLGTFALYYRVSRSPAAEDLRLIERMTHLARIAIERSRAAEALSASEERFRCLARCAPVGIFLTNSQGECLFVNERWCAYTGLSREAALGKGWMRALHPEDRDRVLREWCLAIQAGRDFEQDYRFLTPEGGVTSVHGAATELRDDLGRVTSYVGTIVDLTDRVRSEAERRAFEARAKHAQRLESLGVLAGGIAHDFNNLLTAMLGYSDLAKKHLPDSSAVGPMLHGIEKAALQAADLTRQMLVYSGKGKFDTQVIGLDALVREMAHLLETVVSKKADLRSALAPAEIEGDVAQIRQIVMNLITNASDALGDEGGVITLRTGTRYADAAALHSPYLQNELPEGRYAFVEVQDSGCGMDEDTRARIFDPFFSTKFKGRGLGLAAVLGIVRSHHGTIRVTSQPGAGTTFEILLRLSRPG